MQDHPKQNWLLEGVLHGLNIALPSIDNTKTHTKAYKTNFLLQDHFIVRDLKLNKNQNPNADYIISATLLDPTGCARTTIC